MRHWAFAASGSASRAIGAPLALCGVLACSAPAAVAQGFDGDLSSVAPARPSPSLALSVRRPLPSSLPWQRGGQDVGVSWRTRLGDDKVIDIAAWRRLPQQSFDALSQIQQRDPLYGARVEMKLSTARSRFTTEWRAIGLQLDNGARILLRRRNGNPTLYYRQQF